MDLESAKRAPSKHHLSDEWKANNQSLWDKVLEVASGERRQFTQGDRTINSPNNGKGYYPWPHPQGMAWAVKQYNGFGGSWSKQSKVIQRMQQGAITVTEVQEAGHYVMANFRAQGLVRLSGVVRNRHYWDLNRVGQRHVVASLGPELKQKIEQLIATDPITPRALAEVAKWIDQNFRINSAKTPRGQKQLKESMGRFLSMLEMLGHPGSRINSEAVQNMLSRSWQNIEPDLDNLVKYFTAEGDATRGTKTVLKELKLSNATFLNRSRLSNTKFQQYAEGIDRLLGSLKGWRRKALQGTLKVEFVGARAMKVQGKYRRADDTMLVRATPKVLKRSTGYGSIDYIIIHELGHRYEQFNKLPTNFDRVEWRTTRYSANEGEKFAELFALGHFKYTGSWDQTVVERFEDLMGLEPATQGTKPWLL